MEFLTRVERNAMVRKCDGWKRDKESLLGRLASWRLKGES